MYWNWKNSSPLYVIIRKKGRAVTLATLWASSQLRGPLPGLKVKKSAKIFRCVMTPLTMASSISMVQAPTNCTASAGRM